MLVMLSSVTRSELFLTVSARGLDMAMLAVGLPASSLDLLTCFSWAGKGRGCVPAAYLGHIHPDRCLLWNYDIETFKRTGYHSETDGRGVEWRH